MMDKHYLNVVLTGDESYVTPMGVAMFSIVKNLNPQYTARFFLLVSGWTDKQEEIRLLSNCEVSIIHVEQYLHYFKSADSKKMKLGYIKNLTPYYRLLIPKILPENVDKVFYFDADMVADADLSSIYNTVNEKKLLSAVIELVANAHKKAVLSHLSKWREFSKFNKDHTNAPYFNAGFFLMNLSMARELNIFSEFLSFLEKHPNPPYADQDTLNAVCGQKYTDRMVYLDPSWNVFCDMNYDVDEYFKAAYSHYSIRQSFTNPRIYHYAGANKPWINREVLHYWNVWNNYYEISPFCKKVDNVQERLNNYWLLFCGIPLVRIKRTQDGSTVKTYLLGILPIFRKYPKRLKIYLFGIPLPFIEYRNLRIRLLGIPIIKIKLFRNDRTV